jgi:hypothetical protein
MNAEIARLARHVLPPAIAYAVASGWIPASLQQPLIEAVIAVGAVVTAIFASRSSAKKAAK